ncbi:hypothetical protein DYB36_010923 [Aphanomyces astaci]|uniref:Uncharacterized protein n=1 Tax=Aphanomyces astaci TaxID=112090 RepID=A0A397AP68_APHAT|nr:hypothetical protein DYB36_010923 [Aphanomyces astaci]
MFRAVFAAATRPVALHRPLSRYVHQKQSYEELKADFARWARKEVVLVGLFLATGLGAVAAYTYRSDAPLHQIVYCINQATIAAEKGNALEARQLTQRAYAIAQSVSPHGRLYLDMDRPEKAKPLFDTAKRVAIKCNLPQDKIDLIDDQLAVASRHENGPVDITQQQPHEEV